MHAVGLLLVAVAAVPACLAQVPKLVVILMADDMGYGEVGVMPGFNNTILTPRSTNALGF